jgi:hypothetical protein
MTRLLTIVCSVLSLTALTSAALADTDNEVEARKVALGLAGAFSNDGFKIRDGYWTGSVKPGEPALVAVNLYAGNQYWFSVGSADKESKLAVRLHDEAGRPLPTDNYEEDEKAAAGFSPEISGQYFVSVAPSAGDASTYCLVYSYK